MDQIKYEGKSILCKGYGTIPKFIMQADISIESKAIYAYMCSFAGAGQSAFPSVEKILMDLNISKDRFYKHRKELITNGFIKIERNRVRGKVMKNIYIIPQIVTSIDKEKPCPQNKEMDIKPIPYFKDTEFKDTEFKDTENKDSNNNKTNNNKTNNNNINNNKTDVVVNMDFQKLLKGFDERDIKSILKFCFENEIGIEVVEEKLKIINGMKKVNNRVGALITAIKEDWKPNKGQVNNNCNFSQRDYDYDDLEKKLLGWEE
ncbi:helix-turn-helix domain-containing protein [Clostridium perfringens]|uniref:helix-turn-helix domain-containing protein n=1 Tax=Clostridium perfringens TaxID=1502 RepID=UPI001B8238A8|nr:helix-turn-helix domain-containing protein [Clostridium perfringens]HBC2032347.1 helix-turn-helix domain-containing protein [Clostridium perfringens]HBC2056082.1 helix-turn-helix domain-containing protein [Clostridium perfringens]HBC2069697.1 helix-turn-helix domain-containing protein [Clostridium perfringens]